MAIGVIHDARDASQAQYERVLRQVTPPDNLPIPGLLHFAGGLAEDGVCVIEVWESVEAFQRFFDEHLAPALQAADVTYVPRIFQIVNTNLAM